MNLIVACEYFLYVEAICKVLASEEDIKVVTEAFTPEDVETLIMNGVKADLLILDIDMTDLDLPQVLSLIRKKTPYLKVLLLTAKYDKEKFIEAIHVGIF
jgi:Response regulator containing a CheY-like receiver domain and an HTH DNA-binding domain